MSEFLDYEDIVPELYYAITINSDGVITGRHESKEPITALQFYNNPWLHGDVVKGVTSHSEYAEGNNIACYTEEGMYRGLVWAIENGYEEMPDGYQIVGGILDLIPEPEPEPAMEPKPEVPITYPTETSPEMPITPQIDYAAAIEKQDQEIAELKEMIRALSEKLQ